MQRRFGFLVSLCGIAFAVVPLSRVLPKPDFIACMAGFVFTLLGIFFTIESVAKQRS
jgi:hypothetical protein